MALEQDRVDEDEFVARIVTFEGGARSGKGTTVRAVARELRSLDHEVLVIDQGLKFRSLAYLAIGKGLDLSRPQVVDEYLQQDTTRHRMMTLLAGVAGMANTERDRLLYTREMSAASAQIGASDFSHPLAVGLMKDQIEDASCRGIHDILIDGRSLEGYALEMQERKLAAHVLSIYFACDSTVAAQRSTGFFGEVYSLSDDQRTTLLKSAHEIIKRNSSDMNREVDPLRAPGDAYVFDFMHFDSNREAVLGDIRNHKRMYVDTTATQSIDNMTGPMIEVVTTLLDCDKEKTA